MYTCIVYNGKYLSKYLNDSRFPVFQFVKSKLTLHCVDPLGKKKFKFEQIANRYAKWAAIRWESGQKVVDRGEIVASRAIHLSTNTEATKKVRTCLGRKGRRSSVRGGSMGCRVVLSSCQECNSHAAGIPFHSIPLAASLLWPCTGAASRGGGGLLFHLATSRSLLDPSPSRETEREKERARSGSRNRGSCSRWFRLNAAFRTPSFVSRRLLILSWILVPLREPARSRWRMVVGSGSAS